MATKFKLNKAEKGTCKLDTKAKDKCQSFLTKAKLALYMKRGLDIRDAAKLCRVSEYQLGMLRSDPDFEQLIEYCSADCEQTHLNAISDAGTMGQWQAAAWILERKFPDKYGKKDTIKHEYEIKMMSFQKVILNVINELDPKIRHIIMQKLRNINVESEIYDIQMADTPLQLGGK